MLIKKYGGIMMIKQQRTNHYLVMGVKTGSDLDVMRSAHTVADILNQTVRVHECSTQKLIAYVFPNGSVSIQNKDDDVPIRT